jgi:hypothetical protein
VVLLFVPETRYDRTGIDERTGLSPQTSSDERAPEQDVKQSTTPPKSREPNEKDLASQTSDIQISKKTWLQELTLWTGVPKYENLFTLFIRPFPLFAYPAVIYSFLTYAISLAWVLAINVLNPFVLQKPPYNWRPSINGLINIPGLLGNLAGAWLGGWLVDRYSDWRSKKNAGVFQPETRLHLIIIPALIAPAGCLLFGYGVAEHLHWISL